MVPFATNQTIHTLGSRKCVDNYILFQPFSESKPCTLQYAMTKPNNLLSKSHNSGVRAASSPTHMNTGNRHSLRGSELN